MNILEIIGCLFIALFIYVLGCMRGEQMEREKNKKKEATNERD